MIYLFMAKCIGYLVGISVRECYELVKQGHDVFIDISKPDFNQDNITFIHKNYNELSSSELKVYKCIIVQYLNL